uniref:Uncharacterized protein n=1 Tax=Anguilla anguilla TaxID=7936 RepID=A0A0E9UU36_ANGAN
MSRNTLCYNNLVRCVVFIVRE